MGIVATDADSVRATSPPSLSWREAFKRAIRDPEELCRVLELPERFVEPARRAAQSFPLFAPRNYVARMRVGDPADPLLRQVLPLADENESADGYSADPVDDSRAALQPGLLQKYAGRALLVTTGACAIHCRYCFRRHYPYQDSPQGLDAWLPALDAIRADPSLHEVLLSGGDPLTLGDPFLRSLSAHISQIPHVRRLRIHTRLPIVIPDRVTPELVAWLKQSRLAPFVVVHANHPAELNLEVGAALGRLVDAGIPVLNQAVLLRGVNDDEEVLTQLCERLLDLRVLPYYLHQLDRVSGAHHFEVPVSRGQALVEALRQRLPGYAVPRYVQEIPGAPHKTPL